MHIQNFHVIKDLKSVYQREITSPGNTHQEATSSHYRSTIENNNNNNISSNYLRTRTVKVIYSWMLSDWIILG